MAREKEKKEEEKFEFDAAGEALGYISLDQARVLAIEHDQRISAGDLRHSEQSGKAY